MKNPATTPTILRWCNRYFHQLEESPEKQKAGRLSPALLGEKLSIAELS